ncbi:MAG: DUF4345 domain-containing protein [Acidobacteriota bacterium]
MSPRIASVFLLLSGLLLLGIGGGILLMPQAFHASNGIVLGSDPSLLSEVRAPGGLLAASAVVILLGVFRSSSRPLAMTLSILVYGSFGLARLLAFALDGLPSTGLVAATTIELTVAVVGLVLVRRSHPASAGADPRPLAPATR